MLYLLYFACTLYRAFFFGVGFVLLAEVVLWGRNVKCRRKRGPNSFVATFFNDAYKRHCFFSHTHTHFERTTRQS